MTRNKLLLIIGATLGGMYLLSRRAQAAPLLPEVPGGVVSKGSTGAMVDIEATKRAIAIEEREQAAQELKAAFEGFVPTMALPSLSSPDMVDFASLYIAPSESNGQPAPLGVRTSAPTSSVTGTFAGIGFEDAIDFLGSTALNTIGGILESFGVDPRHNPALKAKSKLNAWADSVQKEREEIQKAEAEVEAALSRIGARNGGNGGYDGPSVGQSGMDVGETGGKRGGY